MKPPPLAATVARTGTGLSSTRLGAVWTGVYPQPERVEGFRRLLGLAKNVTPHSLVPLGYHAEQPSQEERYRVDRIHRDGC